MNKPHVVIVGAGFGGVYVAKELIPLVKKGIIDITIVNKTNYFLFTPLLHEVATGSLSASSVAEPLREIFASTGIDICCGELESINPQIKQLVVSGATLHYDYLLLASGAVSQYYGISGADKYAYPLKTLHDATEIRQRVITCFEKALFEPDPKERAKHLSFVVVGGGPTGVEMVAELAEFTNKIRNRYYSHTNRCGPEGVSVHLIHAGQDILEQYSESLRHITEKRLSKKGIIIHKNISVSNVGRDFVTLSNKTKISARTTIWCAGVKAHLPVFNDFEPDIVSGRLKVNQYFQLSKNEDIFAIGDIAYYENKSDSKPLPMLAQVAVSSAKTVASNIKAKIMSTPLQDLNFQSQGSMVSVGQWFAIGNINNSDSSGIFTWWLWRTVYLFKFASIKKRIRIAFEWTINIFYTRDITVE